MIAKRVDAPATELHSLVEVIGREQSWLGAC